MLSKLLQLHTWKRVYRERLGEPLIYNLAALPVALFGSVARKIDYDLVPRQPYAFGMQQAFELAAAERSKLGIQRLVFIEFGVASGAGLINLCRVGARLSAHYGIPFRVIGFDTGVGMPLPVDYRDHPEKYLDGDFTPHDTDALQRELPDNAEIIYGPIAETVGQLDRKLQQGDVIGFLSVDVDYWSSTVDCLKLLDNDRLAFLPRTPVYLDDVNNTDHHEYAGELLAIAEFNAGHPLAKIVPMRQLRNWRYFKNALWLDQMYWYLDLSHQFYTRSYHADRGRSRLANPYLGV